MLESAQIWVKCLCLTIILGLIIIRLFSAIFVVILYTQTVIVLSLSPLNIPINQ